jgi:hypothetical protein
VETKQSEGRKFDAHKLQWRLLMGGCRLSIQGCLRVLMMGMKKYGANNWQGVEWERYVDALYRHMDLIMRDGLTARDEESGELHAHHVTANALFLAHFAEKASEDRPDVGARAPAVRVVPADSRDDAGYFSDGVREVPQVPTGVVPRK